MQTMTKTRSKTGVKVAVATAALFVAAAAALMIDSMSGTDTVSVNFCAKFDKGIVVQENANDALQTLINGCQKSGWGMSNVSYACGGIDNAYSNSDDGYWNSDDGKGAEKGGAAFYKMSWQPCAGGAIVIEDFPDLIISAAIDTPAANNFSLGNKDLTLASFDFSSNPSAAEPANLKITELVVSVASSGARNCLNNFRLVNEGKNNVAAPVFMADVKKKTASYSSSVLFSNISAVDVDTEGKRTLSVIADVSDQKICAGKAVKLAILPDYSSEVGVQMPVKASYVKTWNALTDANILYLPNAGKAPLSTLKLGTSSQLKADSSGVNANEFVFYTTKLVTSLSADSPQGIFMPGYNTTIGKFKVCSSVKDASVQYVNLSLYPYAKTGQPVANWKVKVKIDDPASLDVFLEKEINVFGNTGFKDADFKNVTIVGGACKNFQITMDTTQLEMIQFAVQDVIWADSLFHNIAANGNILPTPTKVLIK